METTAILLLHCPDQQGIISEVTKFITDNKGNIVYLDQYVDKVEGMFFMRIEWELEGFMIPRDKIYDYITTLYAHRYQMKFSLYYSDKRTVTYLASYQTTKICAMWPNSLVYPTTCGA